MREGWEIKTLGEICELSNGLWTGKNPPFIKINVIRNTNFTKDCKLDDSDIVELEVEKSQFAKRKLSFGDLILEKSGGGPKQPVGRVIIFDKKDGDYSFSNFTSVIKIKNRKQIDFNYLHKFLFNTYVSGATEKMQNHSTGIRNLIFEDYKNIEVAIPPLSKQQQIVSILNEAFAAIDQAKENLQSNLQNAKELFQSKLTNIFINKNANWIEKKLIETFIIKPPKNEAKQKLKDKDLVTFFPMEDLKILDRKIHPKKEKSLKEVINNYTYFANEDVLLAKITPCFENGKLGIAGDLKNGIGFGSSEYIVFRSDGKVLPDFLFYFLSRDKFRIEGQSKMAGAVGHKRVSKDFIENYILPFPSLTEQKKIVHDLDTLSAQTKALENIYQKNLDSLEELRKSILQKAFSGELTIKQTKALA